MCWVSNAVSVTGAMRSSMFMWQDGHQVTTVSRPAWLNFSTVRAAMPAAMRAFFSCGEPQQ